MSLNVDGDRQGIVSKLYGMHLKTLLVFIQRRRVDVIHGQGA